VSFIADAQRAPALHGFSRELALVEKSSKAGDGRTSCGSNDGFTSPVQRGLDGKNCPEGRFFPSFWGFAMVGQSKHKS